MLRSHAVRTVADSAAYLVSSLSAGTRILDVGAGPGSITIDLADRSSRERSSGWMPRRTSSRCSSRRGGATNVTFRTGDAYALDVPDASFDIVHAHQVLHTSSVPSTPCGSSTASRGRRPGRGARDVDYGGVIWHPLIPALDDWLEIYHGVHRGSSGEPDAGRRLKAWAREAGFTRIEASASVWVFDTPDKRAWWGDMWADRVLASAFAGHAQRLGLADDAQLQRISDAWREWAEHPDGWILLPHGEVLAAGDRGGASMRG